MAKPNLQPLIDQAGKKQSIRKILHCIQNDKSLYRHPELSEGSLNSKTKSATTDRSSWQKTIYSKDSSLHSE